MSKETYNKNYNNENKNFVYNEQKKRSHFILPPPAILEAYENLSKGSTQKLLDMAEAEQQHRHQWEDSALRLYVFSNRLGKVCGALVGLSVVASATYLTILGEPQNALIIAACGFGSLALSSIVTLRARKFERKPRKLREPITQDINKFVNNNYNKH